MVDLDGDFQTSYPITGSPYYINAYYTYYLKVTVATDNPVSYCHAPTPTTRSSARTATTPPLQPHPPHTRA